MKITLSKNLTLAREIASKKVNDDAETLRASSIPGGFSMAVIYSAKEICARAFVAKFPDEDNAKFATKEMWLYMFAEVGVTADTPFGVATAIIKKADAWHKMSSEIEKLRITAQNAIRIANSEIDIDNLTNINWPSVV